MFSSLSRSKMVPVGTTSSLEMPTVTVLAWCLMASMGLVRSSMPRERYFMVSLSTLVNVPGISKSNSKLSRGILRCRYLKMRFSCDAVFASRQLLYRPFLRLSQNSRERLKILSERVFTVARSCSRVSLVAWENFPRASTTVARMVLRISPLSSIARAA